MKKAFTIVELLVAMAIIVVLLAGSGFVFHTAVKVEKSARATAEIARKLRGITEQLNADFRGIRYDGEMLVAWEPFPILDSTSTVIGYDRFDQMMFYSNGNFSSYGDSPLVNGNLARIHYIIARPDETLGDPPVNPSDRILARVQHIVSADPALPAFPFFPLVVDDFIAGQGGSDTGFPNPVGLEYDTITMEQWKNIDVVDKVEMLTAIAARDVDIGAVSAITGTFARAVVSTSNPRTIHNLLCEGVGQFIIQHWNETEQRWWPEIDVDGDGDWATGISDWPISGGLLNLSQFKGHIHPGDGTFFNDFGRAFKFTFTLYDSYGVFPEGKTFSHIIYLD
ncbi:MAG: prepilin-type N-terminal cleavage/methylation domain-containing protein [Planctomycetes bacterium]|nr:prepilin-type N-terminal cleavage/methylation domain-containing protein [Planctomycetota bacterium]